MTSPNVGNPPGGPPGGPPPAPPGGGKPKVAAPRAPVDPRDITTGDLAQDAFVAPFANAGHHVDDFGVRWWFQYFWNEARSVKGEGGNARALADVANIIFYVERPALGKVNVMLRDVAKTWTGRSGDIWRDALTRLLKIGFRAVPREGVVPSGAAGLAILADAKTHHIGGRQFGEEVRSWKDLVRPDTIPVYWRSETRPLSMILSQNGTKRQVDVDTIARDLGMTADWHPFSKPEINKFMWYRLGNADNDYYTVISVATDFLTACGFPKIDERRVYFFPPSDPSEWGKDDARRFRNNLGVAMVNGQRRVVVITRTTAYMLVHYGCMLDTQGAAKTQKKESFAEMGVEHIPLENIFGVFPLRRVHHGPQPGDGFTCFLDYANCERINPDRQLDHFGSTLFFRLYDIFQDTKNRGPFATAWGKTGAKDPDIKLAITAINEFPITDGSLQTFLATLPDGSRGGFANKSVHANKAALAKEIEGLGANIKSGLKPIK